MNYLLDEDDIPAHAEREFTLSTGSILGIFFGLVLLCGLFFGFGYSVGSHRSAPPEQASQSAPVPTNFSAFKPSAGLPAGTTSNVPPPPRPAGSIAPAVSNSANVVTGVKGTSGPPSPAATSAPIVRVPPAQPSHAAAPPAPAAPAPLPTPNGTFLVQIAAVSHQQDSALLMNALRIKGYAPSAFLEADKLIHVQLGPYSNRHDADLMRQRLVADGYSPIIK